MKLSIDKNGAAGAKMLVVFVVVIALVLAYMSGMIALNLPSTGDKYGQTVIRGVTDVGLKVPINIKLTFDQDVNTGANQAVIDVDVKHKHESLGSDDNYVPDPKVVSSTSFNVDVGNVGDTKTIWASNGNSFQASNLTLNSGLTSLASVNYGNSQNNYKVWTPDSTYTPPSSVGSTSKDNGAILIQTVWKHYRKATNQLLSADTVSFILYYEMPAYNANSNYEKSYTYYVFVPFDDSALIEDINWEVRSYFENCVIEWTTVSVVTHEYWNFPLLNKLVPGASSQIKLVRSRDVSLATAIQYSWIGPTDLALNNANHYGSHTYQFRVR